MNASFRALSPWKGEAHGQAPVHRRTDRVRAQTGGRRDTGPASRRKLGVAEATFYHWKKQFAGLGISEIRRLKQLEEEDRGLKQVVAHLTLDRAMLQDVARRKW